jgi:peroxiredoxin Q/BCP
MAWAKGLEFRDRPRTDEDTAVHKLIVSLLLFATAVAQAASPQPGDAAPAFRLQDQNGEWRSLSDYKGQWVALYFYPKDDTPGCTTEACAFRDDIFKFKKMGVAIVGVSVDDVASHRSFAEKHKLPFTLLADPEKSVAKEYGVLTTYNGMELASRQTFIIDPEGNVARHYAKVNADEHSPEVLADLEVLIAERSD